MDKILTVRFDTLSELSLSYMSAIEGGGVFIKGNYPNYLGDFVNLKLLLTYKDEQLATQGKIVWVTPIGAQNGMIAGVGVQFTGKQQEQVQKKLEQELSQVLKPNQGRSYTL